MIEELGLEIATPDEARDNPAAQGRRQGRVLAKLRAPTGEYPVGSPGRPRRPSSSLGCSGNREGRPKAGRASTRSFSRKGRASPRSRLARRSCTSTRTELSKPVLGPPLALRWLSVERVVEVVSLHGQPQPRPQLRRRIAGGVAEEELPIPLVPDNQSVIRRATSP